MPLVLAACAFIVVANTLIHYETLRMLNAWLPRLSVAGRFKIVGVILGSFLAHALEIVIYALAIYLIVHHGTAGTFSDQHEPSFDLCLYFSAQAYTTLGFGDVVLDGPVRFIAGVEALQGLLMIGWSTSFAYLTMERFWHTGAR